MYKQYLNDYEKRAEQIRKAAIAIENGKGERMPEFTESKKIQSTPSINKNFFDRLKADDIILLALIFLLSTAEEKDITLIIVIGYIFLCGL